MTAVIERELALLTPQLRGSDRLAQGEHRWRALAPGVLVRHAYP